MEFRKIISLVVCLIVSLGGCGEVLQEEKSQERGDFLTLMGKGHPSWENVRTPEDFKSLNFFQKIYEKNIAYLNGEHEKKKIPPVLHFIWVGPKPFPRESVDNVRTWIAHHPNWKVQFWTDRRRPLPHPNMELNLITDKDLPHLFDFYAKSDNYGEMSDLLRAEILFAHGGVYVDHDVVCLKNFGPLNTTYDFYCGMDLPSSTCLSTSVWPTNNLMGSRSGHPVLAKNMQWLIEHWEQIERDYPGRDCDATINRIAHRTFQSFGLAFYACGNQEGNRDIAFPAYYFNAPKKELALFAQHQYKGTWFDGETPFEKNVNTRLMKLSKKSNKMLLGLSIVFGLNLLGFCLLTILFMQMRKRIEFRR